jgi:hypothetical protein
MDEKRYLMSELNQNRFDRNRWQDFIAFAEKVGCHAMAADMRRRYENYIGEPTPIRIEMPAMAEGSE